jgi:hypothetical protein
MEPFHEAAMRDDVVRFRTLRRAPRAVVTADPKQSRKRPIIRVLTAAGGIGKRGQPRAIDDHHR